jgi:hypothetical protein
MSAKNRHDPAVPQPGRHIEEDRELARAGIGAASALDRMKADHALRRKRQHGAHSPAGHTDDHTSKR